MILALSHSYDEWARALRTALVNFLASPIKFCRIKKKIKGGGRSFLDRIKRLDISRQARGPESFKTPFIHLTDIGRRYFPSLIARCRL